MKTTFLAVSCLFAFGHAAYANEAFEKLLEEVNQKTVFEQVTNSDSCPKSIIPEESEYLPDFAKPGDRKIYLHRADTSNSFVHEGNSLFYRPGLKEGKTHVLDRSMDFILGVAYSVAKQSSKDGVITSTYSAKIGSVAMIGTSNFEVKYDSKADTITYHFSGNGVDDVDCTFKKVK